VISSNKVAVNLFVVLLLDPGPTLTRDAPACWLLRMLRRASSDDEPPVDSGASDDCF
jgi:hypothetical protein